MYIEEYTAINNTIYLCICTHIVYMHTIACTPQHSPYIYVLLQI